MPKAVDLVESLLLPSLTALREVDPAAAAERRRRMGRTVADFVRGSLVLHAAWLAAHPLPGAPWVWSIGDAHCGNLATLATGPLNRQGVSPVTYGFSDVDDEHPAPWHWDLVRLLASAGIVLGDGIGRKRLEELARLCLADYVRVLTAACDDDGHAERLDFHGLPEALKTTIGHDAEPAHLAAYRRQRILRAGLRAGEDCVVDSAAKRLLLPAVEHALTALPPVREWRLVDLARRTASGGLASLGRRRWWVLAQERDRDGGWVPRVLELKERRPSVLSAILPAQPFAPATTAPWTLPMGGDRWQRTVQLGTGDALLRTRCHTRTVLDLAGLDSGDRIRLARLWGQLLAVAHLTSARGLGLAPGRVAAALVVHAGRHGDEVAEMIWDLVRWTRNAWLVFRARA
jgi:hypothetical protein